MQTTDSTAKVLDFNTFREQRSQLEESTNMQFTPTLVWYPVWVMVPNLPTTPGT
jgi:hypothetical protein